MAGRTTIEWATDSWNPLRGCSRVTSGCRACYAEGIAARFSGAGQPYEGLAKRVKRPDGSSEARWTGEIAFVESALTLPLRWRKPRRIFVNSMSDLFHEKVPDAWIDRIFAVMALAKQHTFILLTKRPERMRGYINDESTEDRVWSNCSELVGKRNYDDVMNWPLRNVWLGVSAENQETADKRIPLLLETPAHRRVLSAEPLLAQIDLSRWLELGGPNTDLGLSNPGLSWVIVGGESGPKARPMNPQWARDLRDQCTAAGVPFFFKQNGTWAHEDELTEDGRKVGDVWGANEAGGGVHYWPDHSMSIKVGKGVAGRLLDGKAWNERPRP